MQRFARKHGVRVRGFFTQAMQMMHDHSWPGNVREMQNVIERAIILCGDGDMIEPRHLGLLTFSPAAPDSSRRSPLGRIAQPEAQVEFPTLGELERQHIMSALARCNNNRTHAARLLDISVRTLRNKLNEYRAETSAAEVAGREVNS
jgi:DNA-binding NtrC family response regulator